MRKLILLLVALVAAPPTFAWTQTQDYESGTLGDPVYGGVNAIYDNTRAVSASQSARIFFPVGTHSSGIWVPRFTQNVQTGGEVWLRGYYYYPVDFDWTCVPVVKVLRLHVSDSSETNRGYISFLANSNGNIVLSNEIAGVQQTTAASYDRGSWQYIELYVKLSSISGQGIVRMWKNGVLALEDTIHVTLGAATDVADFILVHTYWNGDVTQDQYAWVDDVEITTDRPSNQDAAGNYMIGSLDSGAPANPGYAPFRRVAP